MIFSKTAAKVDSPFHSFWQLCREDRWKIDEHDRYQIYSRLTSQKILALYEIPYLWEQKEEKSNRLIYLWDYLLVNTACKQRKRMVRKTCLWTLWSSSHGFYGAAEDQK